MSIFRDSYGPRLWPVIAIITVILLALIGVAVWASAKDEAACKAKGGHIVSHTGTGTGVSSSGKVVTVITTNDECVVPQ